mgnify:CR=1 FL=1
MAVKSIKPYIGTPRDLVANFNGKQIVYVCWNQHLLFAAPFMLVVEPGMRFGDLLEPAFQRLPRPDPEPAASRWSVAGWQKRNQAWTPDFNASIAANGIAHKEQLRFSTPGLNALLAAA